MKRNFLTYILLCILFLGSAACQDDPLYNGGETGEGESLVSATVKFKPLTPALNGNTRTAGNVIKNIKDLCVLLYNEKGELLKTYPLTEGTGEGQYQLEDKDRPDNNPDSGLPPAEAQTPHADFKLKIPYGRYRIYAVANMEKLLTNETYSKAIETADGLKSISLQWDKDEVANNNQMFGYFTVTGSEQNDEVAVINRASVKLHAWIRRAASKVTIAYDGSDLHENVYIYLKSVTIKDIPTECYLGKKSTINRNPDDDIEDYGDLIADGESITYAEGTSYDEHWTARITKGKPYYYYIDNGQKGVSVAKAEYDSKRAEYAKLAHGETNEALFFYENMQGKGKDKQQDADGDKELDAPGLNNKPGDKYYKDQKPYGTYIEVKAYYVSNVDGRVGNGDIIYRFMLGKDVYTDYNAERNHHYKLTLKFNKYANDVDWHIEYEEPEPGIEVPNPYYISYLYNHSMMLPLKIRTGGQKIEQIEARIMDNRWAPNNPATDFVYWKNMNLPYQNQWNGFLSLRQTKDLNVTANSNEEYYQSHKRGEREYIPAGEKLPESGESKEYETFDKQDNSDGKCIVRNEGDSVFHVQLPMYTRAKQLIKNTGYTGNNPYVAYQRKSEVKIVVTFMNGSKISTDGTDFDGRPLSNADNKDNQNPVIYQVRRIVNPKGVWRSHNNDNDFHVQLKRLPRENATQFETFTSEGPWKAYVYCGTDNFITLSDETRASTDTIKGETGSAIDFRIKFNGTCGQQENRYAIIRVEYHNYTCYHLIFVRQGDAPDDLFDGTGTKWHAHNLRTSSKETDSPLEEGSLFKFQNLEQPIDAMCNKNPTSPWININPGSFQNDADKLQIATNNTENKTNTTWNSIKSIDFSPWGNTEEPEFGTPEIPKARIASFEDFLALYQGEDIAEGYGVLYGDESQETLDRITEVYEYNYEQTRRGMRGCFVYNKKNGKNLFFPIGASGYGHRKNHDREGFGSSTPEDGKGVGVLRYAAYRNTFLAETTANNSPLLYDIYMRPGAVYWLNKYNINQNHDMGVDFSNVIAWDFNYFTFDFYPFGISAAQSGKDACFIRCVEE
ncbi:fimbrial protein [Bacteroides sp. KH569_7]|uniref:Fimbrial protein n=1 Tax=Bacteroides muris (ex Fokt et al. 2023) TaxID=2937417 RepID=A0A9X2NZ07_9BACE|nr:fimbrial protein [Bacteroides muris (ex Fokt et al. 2023)]MCR6508956.1 fimbrial protein [Bacteroides muris (ex Fokt et al. 2023)]